MSAGAVLQAAVVAALEGIVTAFDAPPVRGAAPYAVVEAPVLADWSTKDIAGREGVVAVTIHDEGERPVRLRAIQGTAEDAVLELARDVGGGWRWVVLVLARSRMVRREGLRWVATSEFRVRMLRES